MLKRLDNTEAQMQRANGNRINGSMRSSNWLDAEALRAVMKALDISAVGVSQ